MSDELITPENVSKESLKSLFDAAFMEAGYDKDGDLFVQDRCKCFIFCDEEDQKKRVIRLRTYFRFEAGASDAQRLKCVNEINANYLIVCAVANDRVLMFKHDIPLDGGITKKAFVLLVKRFCSIPHDAVSDYGSDIVE